VAVRREAWTSADGTLRGASGEPAPHYPGADVESLSRGAPVGCRRRIQRVENRGIARNRHASRLHSSRPGLAPQQRSSRPGVAPQLRSSRPGRRGEGAGEDRKRAHFDVRERGPQPATRPSASRRDSLERECPRATRPVTINEETRGSERGPGGASLAPIAPAGEGYRGCTSPRCSDSGPGQGGQPQPDAPIATYRGRPSRRPSRRPR